MCCKAFVAMVLFCPQKSPVCFLGHVLICWGRGRSQQPLNFGFLCGFLRFLDSLILVHGFDMGSTASMHN